MEQQIAAVGVGPSMELEQPVAVADNMVVEVEKVGVHGCCNRAVEALAAVGEIDSNLVVGEDSGNRAQIGFAKLAGHQSYCYGSHVASRSCHDCSTLLVDLRDRQSYYDSV